MFVLYQDWRQADEELESAALRDAHQAYASYLEAQRHLFPSEAFEFATAPWHHNYLDPRALHDSWVVSVSIYQTSPSSTGSGGTSNADIELLGAYHDGHLQLRYEGIHRYSIDRQDVTLGPTEIYRDEVRLTDSGRVLHEIEFLAKSNWTIECDNLIATWVPLNVASKV